MCIKGVCNQGREQTLSNVGVGDDINCTIFMKVIERVCIKGMCKRWSVRVWGVVNLFFFNSLSICVQMWECE